MGGGSLTAEALVRFGAEHAARNRLTASVQSRPMRIRITMSGGGRKVKLRVRLKTPAGLNESEAFGVRQSSSPLALSIPTIEQAKASIVSRTRRKKSKAP